MEWVIFTPFVSRINQSKTMNRRKFIQNSGLALASSLYLSESLFASLGPKHAWMGLQLYSVRDDMHKDPMATLKKLSEMGYKQLEHANYSDGKFYGYAPLEFKKIMDDLGMRVISGHSVLSDKFWDSGTKQFNDHYKKTVEDAAILCQKYLISPWLDESLRKDYDSLVQFLEIFNKAGELCKKSGIQFGYHNHDFEFKNSLKDKLVYEIILENTDSKLVAQQLDVGNMYGAGGRASELLKKYPGRFESIHIKDEIKSSGRGEMNDGYESTILGKGILDMKVLLDEMKEKGGTKLWIIEQESYQDMPPIDCVKEDLKAMKSWGF